MILSKKVAPLKPLAKAKYNYGIVKTMFL